MSESPPLPVSWAATRRLLAEDATRLRQLIRGRYGISPWFLWLDASFQCVLLHRLAHFLWSRGWRKTARIAMQANSFLTGADLHPHSELGGGLLIPHPVAITVSGRAGRNCTLMPLAGFGMLPRDKDIGAGAGLPVLGDDVWLGAGSGILGPVHVGSGARLQPGAPVIRDMPPRSLVEEAVRPRMRPVIREAEIQCGETKPLNCDHGTWQATWRDFSMDVARYLSVREPGESARPSVARRLSAALSIEVLGVGVYRLSHFLFRAGWPGLAYLVRNIGYLALRLNISPDSCLGGGVFLPHPAGVVLEARAGTHLTVYARALCTGDPPAGGESAQRGPVLGNRVVIAGMAGIYGPVIVGDDARIGPNLSLAASVPAGSVVAGRTMRALVEPLAGGHHDVPVPPAASPASTRYASERALLAEDLARLREVLAGRVPWAGAACVILFRHAHYFWRRGAPRISRFLWQLNVRLTGADIDPRSEIGGGMVVPYPAGISLHLTAGRRLTVWALVTIGGEHALDPDCADERHRPHVGDDVVVEPHASLHGPITVGSGARIGAGCRIRWDIPPETHAFMPPPRACPTPASGASEGG